MSKLFVICGHGAGDSGACGNGYEEAERVRVLGKRIKALGGDNVTLGDINRDWYGDNGISKLSISKDYQIIELHMDDAAPTARGAHVIIYAGTTQDNYDVALAKYLSGLLPGRADSIVKRNDLANPARAYAMGYGYRLVEIGFISNADDVSIFNNNIDNIAKGILSCFDIPVIDGVQEKPATPPKPSKPSAKWKAVKEIGTFIPNQYVEASNEPTQASKMVAYYEAGMPINYDSYVKNDGYVFVSYISKSGVRRYVPCRNISTNIPLGTFK